MIHSQGQTDSAPSLLAVALSTRACVAPAIRRLDRAQGRASGSRPAAPWEVEGLSRAVHLAPPAALTSDARLSQVDLDASEKANRPPAPPSQTCAQRPIRFRTRPKPALVLDNTNVARARTHRELPPTPTAEAAPEASRLDGQKLRVASWQETGGRDRRAACFGGTARRTRPTTSPSWSKVQGDALRTPTDACSTPPEGTMPAASVGPQAPPQSFEVAFPNSVYRLLERRVRRHLQVPQRRAEDDVPASENDPEAPESSARRRRLAGQRVPNRCSRPSAEAFRQSRAQAGPGGLSP